ncbi:hypothetical protein ACHAWF_013438 [Thalassiosira exigua]
MPPPPPDFLPLARRRRRLDPARRLKSRELWNKVRFHASASAEGSSAAAAASRAAWAAALLRAVAYELQPFPVKPALRRAREFVVDEGGLRTVAASVLERAEAIAAAGGKLAKFLRAELGGWDVRSLASFAVENKSPLLRFSLFLIALRLYHRLLLYLHELLHAGPIVLIFTLLALLYTVGLGDGTGADSGIPSAYSVFNRGMRRILGTADAEEMARQYAGGAAMLAGGGARRAGDWDEDNDDGVWIMDEGEPAEEPEENAVNERRRQRRLERLARRGGDDQDGEGEGEADEPPPQDDSVGDGEGGGGALDPGLDEAAPRPEDGTVEAAPAMVARVSGKRARRRNLERRREIQRQRQAAAEWEEMGVLLDENRGADGEGGGVGMAAGMAAA